MQAAEDGTVALQRPFQIKDVAGNGRVERVMLFHSEDEGTRSRSRSTPFCSSSDSRRRSAR